MQEPKLHTAITGELPEDHKLAFEEVVCPCCGEVLHDLVNECRRNWVETGTGNFCLNCFIDLVSDVGQQVTMGDEWGLKDE